MSEWNVSITTRGVEGVVEEEALFNLAEVLSAQAASVSGAPQVGLPRYGVQMWVEASCADAAGHEASRIFAKAVAEVGLPQFPIVHLEVMDGEDFDRSIDEPTIPELVGTVEIAEMLHVSRQRVAQLAAEAAGFPHPVAELRAGKVWTRPAVDRFVESWARQSGRPRALECGDCAGPLTPTRVHAVGSRLAGEPLPEGTSAWRCDLCGAFWFEGDEGLEKIPRD